MAGVWQGRDDIVIRKMMLPAVTNLLVGRRQTSILRWRLSYQITPGITKYLCREESESLTRPETGKKLTDEKKICTWKPNLSKNVIKTDFPVRRCELTTDLTHTPLPTKRKGKKRQKNYYNWFWIVNEIKKHQNLIIFHGSQLDSAEM